MTVTLPRHSYEILPPRQLTAPGARWSHEIQIALPPTYHLGEARYPVLWLMDGSISFSLAVGVLNTLGITGEIPELLVVGVGAPRELDGAEFGNRRVYDLYPTAKWANSGPGGAMMAAVLSEEVFNGGGGAKEFLSFLVDELRPTLAAELRFADDHGIVGCSAGGHFVGYALFTRTAAFSRYLAGSPPMSGSGGMLFELEDEYAMNHDDLPVRLFLGAGGAEITDPYLAAADVVASSARMAQQLTLRNYPGLELTMQVFPGQTHASAQPYALTEGLRVLYPITPPTTEELIESVGAGRQETVTD